VIYVRVRILIVVFVVAALGISVYVIRNKKIRKVEQFMDDELGRVEKKIMNGEIAEEDFSEDE